MLDAIAVFLGGGLGSLGRWALTLVPWKTAAEAGFPLATLVTNVAGAFLIGVVVAATAPAGLSPRATLLLKTGVCGGFTTFSTFALETGDLIERGAYGVAAAYLVLSFVLGVAACLAAQALVASVSAR